MMNRAINRIIPDRSIGTVLLGADWNADELPALLKTVDLLQNQGVKVVLVGPMPTWDQAFPRLLANLLVGGGDISGLQVSPRLVALDETMNRLASTRKVRYISLLSVLCPASKCIAYASPGVPTQFDHVHLTLEGSRLAGREIHSRFPDLFGNEKLSSVREEMRTP